MAAVDPPSPVFSITRNGRPLCSVPIDAGVAQTPATPSISEEQLCGFLLEHREPDTEYLARVGDFVAESVAQEEVLSSGPGLGIPFGGTVLWQDGLQFESTRGLVVVRLASRSVGSAEPWRHRAHIVINAVPSKVGELRYRAMFDELRGLAAGIVFDLVSKTTRSLGFGEASAGVSIRSSHFELRIVEHLWEAIAAALLEIARCPVTALRPTRQVRRCWGAEPLGSRSLADLSRRGIDPRRVATARPFSVLQERLKETYDTIEHRIIIAFLRFLRDRIRECAMSIDAHLQAIERDRPLRDRSIGTGPTLYEMYDGPRVRRLQEARGWADQLTHRIRAAETLPILRGLAPLARLPRTAVFDNVGSYYRLRKAMIRYLTTSLIILDDGTEERIKSTSRMYEQWSFLQIAAALRSLGLRCESLSGLIRRSTLQRYILDVDRGTRVTFRTADGRAISLRYEPAILPVVAARERRDTVYRGYSGDTPWCPDILLEVLGCADSAGEAPDVEYAIVIDAKYSKHIQEHHWERVGKYLEIRATKTDRQVVRQLWLAYPAKDAGVVCRDPAVVWSMSGPNRPRDETIQGTLGLVPPEASSYERGEPGEVLPTETAREFVRGILAYLGIVVPIAAAGSNAV